MSIVKELKDAILDEQSYCNMQDMHWMRFDLFQGKILEGKYGTEIMLDWYDLLGGDSVAFVAKYAAKGVPKTSSEQQLDLFDK